MDSELTKRNDNVDSSRWAELREQAKCDPELAKDLEAAETVMRENRDVLRRLAADSETGES
jgi:hypothetical protein